MPYTLKHYECSNCGKIVIKPCFRFPLLVGCEYLYSDQIQTMPLVPKEPTILKCNKCNSFFWFGAVIKRKEHESDILKNIDYLKPLNGSDFIEALEVKVYRKSNEEILIRTWLWRCWNKRLFYNPLEREKSLGHPESITIPENLIDTFEYNCFRLVELLDTKNYSGNKMAIAEIYRTMGWFSKSISVLEEIDRDIEGKKLRMELCKKKIDAAVQICMLWIA